jgi:hypothetical protein
MTIEIITTQAGSTIIGNLRVFQSESNWVQKMLKKMKLDASLGTTVKSFNFLKMELLNH